MKCVDTALLALVFLCAPVVADAESTVPTAGVNVGDTWVYERTDDITGRTTIGLKYVVTEHTDKQVVMRASENGRDALELTIFDTNWNLISEGQWRKKPNDGTGINGPLEIGAQWRFKHSVQSLQTGKAYHAEGSAKIEAKESVSTSAGTFEAFKVVTEIDREHGADPTRREHFTVTTWYAPAVNRWVKRTVVARVNGHLASSATMQLTAYLPRK
jgi:hypothetical protein